MNVGDRVTHAARGEGEVVGFDIEDRAVIQFNSGERVRIDRSAVQVYLSGNLGTKSATRPRKSGKISKVRP